MDEINEVSKKIYFSSVEEHGKFVPTDPLPSLHVQKIGSLFAILDITADQKIINKTFAFGKMMNNNTFILSPYEVMFLKQIGCEIGLQISETDLWKHCCSICGPSVFPIQYAIYHYFRCRYWVVRDGSIYGAIFVLYCDHPDLVHSQFTVHIVNDWDRVIDIAPSITRINWGIKKSGILAKVIVPDDSDLNDPKCISNFVVEAINIKRIRVSY